MATSDRPAEIVSRPEESRGGGLIAEIERLKRRPAELSCCGCSGTTILLIVALVLLLLYLL